MQLLLKITKHYYKIEIADWQRFLEIFKKFVQCVSVPISNIPEAVYLLTFRRLHREKNKKTVWEKDPKFMDGLFPWDYCGRPLWQHCDLFVRAMHWPPPVATAVAHHRSPVSNGDCAYDDDVDESPGHRSSESSHSSNSVWFAVCTL